MSHRLPKRTAEDAFHQRDTALDIIQLARGADPLIDTQRVREAARHWLLHHGWSLLFDETFREQMLDWPHQPKTTLWALVFQLLHYPQGTAEPHWAGMWDLWLSTYLPVQTAQPLPIAENHPAVHALTHHLDELITVKTQPDRFYDEGAVHLLQFRVPVGAYLEYKYLRPSEFGFLQPLDVLKLYCSPEELKHIRDTAEADPRVAEHWQKLRPQEKDVWRFHAWLLFMDRESGSQKRTHEVLAVRRLGFNEKDIWFRLKRKRAFGVSGIEKSRPLLIHSPVADRWLVLDTCTQQLWSDGSFVRALLYWQYLITVSYEGRLANHQPLLAPGNIHWRTESLTEAQTE